jgi:hypothetical protein
MAAGNVQASQLLYLRTPSSGRKRYIASVLTKPNPTRRCFGTPFEQGKQFVKDAAVEITSLTPSNIRYLPSTIIRLEQRANRSLFKPPAAPRCQRRRFVISPTSHAYSELDLSSEE